MVVHRISIRFIAVSLFLFLAFSVLGMTYYAQYNFIKKISKQSTDTQFRLLTSKLDIKLKNIDKYNTMLVDMFATELKDVNISYIQKHKKEYLKKYTIFLSTYDDMYSVYIGTKDNRFFEVINLGVSKSLIKKYNANQKDRWIVIEMEGKKGIQNLSFYDKDLKNTKNLTINKDYKPSQRPWYKSAIESKTTKTDPYRFSSIDANGVTYTKKVKSGMVVSLDILVKDIDKILSQKENANLISSYMLNRDYQVIASSSEKENFVIKYIIKNISSYDNQQTNDIKNINGAKYICYVKKINEQYLVSYANLDDLSKAYRKKFIGLTLFTTIIAIFLFPLVWIVASYVIKPILLLSKESQKITEHNFNDIKKLDSRISEVSILSNSMYKMAQSIKNNNQILEERVKERTKELEKLSVTDKLTGIYNRLKIDKSLKAETLRYNRYKRKFGIILLDIDHFKEVNDTYGHQAGDKVLVEFAKILKNNVRNTDMVGRWGGEEFIVICLEIDVKNLTTLAKKLKNEIENFQFSHVKRKTASFGIVVYEDGEKIEHFISRADKALYKAKENGRNIIEVG